MKPSEKTIHSFSISAPKPSNTKLSCLRPESKTIFSTHQDCFKSLRWSLNTKRAAKAVGIIYGWDAWSSNFLYISTSNRSAYQELPTLLLLIPRQPSFWNNGRIRSDKKLIPNIRQINATEPHISNYNERNKKKTKAISCDAQQCASALNKKLKINAMWSQKQNFLYNESKAITATTTTHYSPNQIFIDTADAFYVRLNALLLSSTPL